MVLTVKHSTVTGAAANPAVLVDGPAWDANHTITGGVPSDVGLGNVDNTSDANKPVSSATQTALNLKAPLASPALTGTASVTGGTIADGTTVLAVTGTHPTTQTVQVKGLDVAITSAGSTTTAQSIAANFSLLAGYTGSTRTTAVTIANNAQSTAATLIPASGGNSNLTNTGFTAVTTGATVGYNVGARGGAQSGLVNVGFLGLAQVPGNGATNIGVAGSAINTGTTPVQIGGYFSLNQTAVPTVSAALIADNGSQSDPIARFRAAGVDKVVFGGTGLAAFSVSPTAPTPSILDNSTKLATTAYVDRTTRERLTATTTIYVNNSTGNDSNSGRSSGAALATLSAAFTQIFDKIDKAGQIVIVQCAASQTWDNVSFVGNAVGNGAIILDGGGGTFRGTGGNHALTVQNGIGGNVINSSFLIQNVTITTDGTVGGNGIAHVAGYATLNTSVAFGSVAGGAHIQIDGATARMFCLANYTISGSAAWHWLVAAAAVGIDFNQGNTVTLSGTPAFSQSFANVQIGGGSIFTNVTFSGSATGKRFVITRGGNFTSTNTSSTYLPGNAAGTVDSGGTYNDQPFVSLTADVSGTLPVANGGTGNTGGAWTTYTPTITANTGTFTSVSAAGRYRDIGKTRVINVVITLTTVGTGAGSCNVPMPSGTAAVATMLSGGNLNDGQDGCAGILATASSMLFIPGAAFANGKTYIVSGTIELA